MEKQTVERLLTIADAAILAIEDGRFSEAAGHLMALRGGLITLHQLQNVPLTDNQKREIMQYFEMED